MEFAEPPPQGLASNPQYFGRLIPVASSVFHHERDEDSINFTMDFFVQHFRSRSQGAG